MIKREAAFLTNHVGPWILTKAAILGRVITCEAKETDTTVGDNNFEPQQLPSLRQSASAKGLYVKIPDGSGLATPFDSFFVANAYALVAIQYRGKGWVLIEISKWDNKLFDRVDWEYAKELADYWYV